MLTVLLRYKQLFFQSFTYIINIITKNRGLFNMPTLSTTAFESLCRIIRNYRAAGKYIMAVKVYEDYACYMTQEQLREAHRTLWNY